MARLQNPSPTKPIVSYPLDALEDREVVTIHDSRLPDYEPLAYGTPHPDQTRFPGLYLLSQGPVDPNDDRMVKRVWGDHPGVELKGIVVTPKGQVGTYIKQEVAPGTEIVPDALMESGKVEPLTATRSSMETITVPEVFPETVLKAQKPDTIPDRFRVSKPSEVESTLSAGTVTTPDATGDVHEHESRQETEFKARDTVISMERTGFDPLRGRELEEQFNIQIPYEEKILTALPSGSAEVQPLGDGVYLAKIYDPAALVAAMESVLLSHPTRTSLDVPPELKILEAVWDQGEGKGTYEAQLLGDGWFRSASYGDDGKVRAFISRRPVIRVELEDVYGSVTEATSWTFFTQGPVTKAKILARTGAQAFWPKFKPRSVTFVARGVTLEGKVDLGFDANFVTGELDGWLMKLSKGTDYSRQTSFQVVQIPQCLTTQRTLDLSVNINKTVPVMADIPGWGGEILVPPATMTAVLQLSENFNNVVTIPATSPPSVPKTGVYLLDSDVSFYKYGFYLVRATTINASQFA